MAALAGLLSPGEWKITTSSNLKYWPIGSTVTVSQGTPKEGKATLDLHWTDCEGDLLSLLGVPVGDGRAAGMAEAKAPPEKGVEKDWHVTLETFPGKLEVTVAEPASSASARHQRGHLTATWGADAGG